MQVNNVETFLSCIIICAWFEINLPKIVDWSVHTVLLCHRHRPLCSAPVFGGNRSNCAPWRHGNGNLHFSHCWDPNRTSRRPQVRAANCLTATPDWRRALVTLAKSLCCVRFHRELLGREEHWPILLSTTCVPAIVQLIILPWFPESPRYLFIDRKDEDSCKKGKSEERSDCL